MDALVSNEKNGSVIGAIRHALSKFGTVDGRASRSEFWYFVLFVLLGSALASFLDAILGTEWLMVQDGRLVAYFGHLQFLWTVATMVPSVTVGVRRLHDIGKSGWWLLLGLLPVVGWLILIYWHCCAGPSNENEYGEEPLYFV